MYNKVSGEKPKSEASHPGLLPGEIYILGVRQGSNPRRRDRSR